MNIYGSYGSISPRIMKKVDTKINLKCTLSILEKFGCSALSFIVTIYAKV